MPLMAGIVSPPLADATSVVAVLYAFGFDRIGVVASDLYFLDPNPAPGQEGAEQGVRLEVRLFERRPLQGSIYSAQPIEVGRPIWRADLLESVDNPGSFDRAHHHPRFRDYEPGGRHFVEELSADPVVVGRPEARRPRRAARRGGRPRRRGRSRRRRRPPQGGTGDRRRGAPAARRCPGRRAGPAPRRRGRQRPGQLALARADVPGGPGADHARVADRRRWAPRSWAPRCSTSTPGTTGRLRLGLGYADGSDGPGVGLRQAAAVRRVAAQDGRRHRHGPAGGSLLRRARPPRCRCASPVPTSPPPATSRPSTSWSSRTSRRPACTFTKRLEPHDPSRAAAAHRVAGPRARAVLERPALRRRALVGATGDAWLVRRQADRQRPRAVRDRVPAGVHRALPAVRPSTTSGSPSCGTRASGP